MNPNQPLISASVHYAGVTLHTTHGKTFRLGLRTLEQRHDPDLPHCIAAALQGHARKLPGAARSLSPSRSDADPFTGAGVARVQLAASGFDKASPFAHLQLPSHA